MRIMLYSKRDFNPRSREGSDALKQSAFCIIIISIHAPARGATIAVHATLSRLLIFQSTLPRGERLGIVPQNISPILFQSTLPRGERPCFKRFSCKHIHFNPRSREGSDRKYTQTTNIISVYFYLYYIIFVSLATNTAYITITKPSKCRCESPYTFC